MKKIKRLIYIDSLKGKKPSSANTLSLIFAGPSWQS